MVALTKKIADLEAELERYQVDLNNTTSPEEKKLYLELIKVRSDVLSQLLKQQNKGNY